MTRAQVEAKGFDLKAVNPHAKADEDTRTPSELMDVIESKNRAIADALAELRKLTRAG